MITRIRRPLKFGTSQESTENPEDKIKNDFGEFLEVEAEMEKL